MADSESVRISGRSSARPRSVKFAVGLMLLSFLFGAAAFWALWPRLREIDLPPWFWSVVFVGLTTYIPLIYLVWSGKNWARILYCAVILFGLVGFAAALPRRLDRSELEAAMVICKQCVELVAVVLLLRNDASDFFRRRVPLEGKQLASVAASATGVLPPFHLAIPVHDIAAAREFYGGKLGFAEGRSAERWVDFDMYGHQLVVHLVERAAPAEPTNSVDGDAVPVPHFGVVLEFPAWQQLALRLREELDEFVIEPRVRFEGQPGEQGTLFVRDPAGNVLEFKGFRDVAGQLFAT